MVSAIVVIIAFTFVVLASHWLTLKITRFALHTGLRDIPNARSSHRVPTPRGGGLAIVVIAWLCWAGLLLAGFLNPRAAIGLLMGSALIALVGWIDDQKSVSARFRLLVHFVAAGGMLFTLGGSFQLSIIHSASALGHAVSFGFALLYLVWMTNLYNFMDGIDGIAASEAVTGAAILAVIAVLSGMSGLALAYGALSVASLGFLFSNWQPAKIFMGDIGSGFLGFSFAALSLMAENNSHENWKFPILATLVTLAVFIVDSGLTLFRRAIRGEKLSVAHRNHAYQWAVRSGYSHQQVTGSVIAMNCLWLAPCALATWIHPSWGLVIMLASWIPILILAFQFGSGTAE